MQKHTNRPEISIYREQAVAARLKKKEEASFLKQDWEDMPHWKELASKYNVRLPTYYQPATETKYLKRLLKHLGVDQSEYLEACGVASVKELVSLNPTYPAYVECGLLLEYYDESIQNKDVNPIV